MEMTGNRYFIRLIICLLIATHIGSLTYGQVLVDSDLPIIKITTSGSIPSQLKTTGTMSIANYKSDRNNIEGPYNEYDGKIGIELRGSSSLALFPKKGYAIETRDADGENLNVPLFGMPEENDWVLHGPYSDKSLIRNALAYSIAGDIMSYAPRIQFCELVINGEYLGVYLFTEKIKRDKGRVAVSKLSPDEIEGDDLTGGYILKFDKYDGEEVASFKSKYPADLRGFGSTQFQYHYPKPSNIVPAQENYIKTYINNLEDAIISADYMNPQTGYRKYLDTKSFIDLIFVNEISKNVDGYRLSTYMYKDKDSESTKLHMGPVWDYNLAFANADYCTQGNTTGLVFLDFNNICGGDNWIVHFWWQRLWNDPSFKTELGNQWVDLRESVLSTDNLVAKIDSFENLLQESQRRNFSKWQILGNYIWPNYRVYNSYETEVNAVRTFVIDRMAWLDTQFVGLASNNENLLPSKDLLIYPNPTEDFLTIRFDEQENLPIEIKVFNNTGKLVSSIQNKTLSPEINLETKSFETGMHYLMATTKQGKFYIKKFVKN